MFGIDENQSLADPAFAQAFLHIRGYVDKGSAGGDVKPEFLAVAFHNVSLANL
jgi:hypothetical protein